MLRTLLIDNGSIRTEELRRLLGSGVTVITHDQLPLGSYEDYELIVLSGSSQFPVIGNQDRLLSETQLIQETLTPLIGICFGCELIAHTFGGILKDMGEKSHGIIPIRASEQAEILIPGSTFTVYESHRWKIATLPKDFFSLADSPHGPEIIKHRTRPIYGLQFHPEHLTASTTGNELFERILSEIRRENI